MSVLFRTPYSPRAWRGYDDPGLPVGMYIAYGVVLGDASGGRQEVEIEFKRANAAVSGNHYNIEQMNVFVAGTVTTLDLKIQAINFERLQNFMIGERIWRYDLSSDGSAAVAGSNQAISFPLPKFLGQGSIVPGEASTFTCSVNNVLSNLLSVAVQGYIWEPRSMMAPGGLRRPIDGLYGR